LPSCTGAEKRVVLGKQSNWLFLLYNYY
jgi:hypothetical protein